MFGMGGIMGAANRLMAAGLSMGQVQSVTREVVATPEKEPARTRSAKSSVRSRVSSQFV